MLMRMRKKGLSDKAFYGLAAFFALNPLFPLWGMTHGKDTLFAIVMVWAVIYLYDALAVPQIFSLRRTVRFSLLFLLLMLLDNSGFYVLAALLLLLLFALRKEKRVCRKMAAVVLMPLLIYKIGLNMILFPYLRIQESPLQEKMSVPIQQTARYVRDYKDEITEEEKQSILAILHPYPHTLEQIAKIYIPYISDPIKFSFNKYATDKDLKNYFMTWKNQFFKHPKTYIQAFLNMNYAWFSYNSQYDIPDFLRYEELYRKDLWRMLPEMKTQNVSRLRRPIFLGISVLQRFPVTSWIPRTSSYTWALFVLLLVMLIRKDTRALLAAAPLLLNQIIHFFGPVAYIRYSLPLMFCLPYVAFIAFSVRKDSFAQKSQKE